MLDRKAAERIERMNKETDRLTAVRKRQFMRIDLLEYIRHQRISVWWNSDDRNAKLSAAFTNLVLSLIDGKCNDAIRYRKEIADSCTPWFLCCKSFLRLAYIQYDCYCEATGRRMLEPSVILTALGVAKHKSSDFFASIDRRLCRSKIAAKAYSAFLAFKNAEEMYYNLPVKNCAVCATMGAGKSTFINALLGCDVLPARNEATTAKITSVYDRDGQTRMSGFFQGRKGAIGGICDKVTLKVLDEWNNNKEVMHLFLSGDLDGIGNNGMVVAVHDTPGTNNSSDHSHHHITMKFLSGNQIDLLLFVLNAEHLGTTDENALLCEVYRSVVRKHGLPVLFILNKKDSVDPDKEDIDKMVFDVSKQLEEIGYDSPTIIPVASKTARLLKMSAKGLAPQMSPKERHELAMILDGVGDAQKLLNTTGLPCVEEYLETFLQSKE